MEYPKRPSDPGNVFGEKNEFSKDDTGPTEELKSFPPEIMKKIEEIRERNLKKFDMKI